MPLQLMTKYICILAGAALLAACEQKTETVAPATSPTPATTEVTSPAATEAPTASSDTAVGTEETPAESPSQQ
jgi:PBP1b-binding outer membrane lipoprotein LpoB